MADISKIKIPAGTTYNVKDATARSNITKITNKTTKLAYGDELSLTGDTLSLLDPNDKVLSSVVLGGIKKYAYDATGFTYADTTYTGSGVSKPYVRARIFDLGPITGGWASTDTFTLPFKNVNSESLTRAFYEGFNESGQNFSLSLYDPNEVAVESGLLVNHDYFGNRLSVLMNNAGTAINDVSIDKNTDISDQVFYGVKLRSISDASWQPAEAYCILYAFKISSLPDANAFDDMKLRAL